jgi:hypothetical protein
MGKAFLPFQQLLGVLPPLSSALMPGPYRNLMTNPAVRLRYGGVSLLSIPTLFCMDNPVWATDGGDE